MVRCQIAARGVKDRAVLAAMRTVPRAEFVPEEMVPFAYEDRPLAIGWQQTISQPFIVGHMTQLCGLRGGERILEVGTGSGYQAAVLAEIAAKVYTIEIVEPLARRAAAVLRRLCYDNVVSRFGDGAEGWPALAPFDVIVVTAAPTRAVPQPLLDQLADRGRLVAPVGTHDQRLMVTTRTGGAFKTKRGVSVRFVPLTGSADT